MAATTDRSNLNPDQFSLLREDKFESAILKHQGMLDLNTAEAHFH